MPATRGARSTARWNSLPLFFFVSRSVSEDPGKAHSLPAEHATDMRIADRNMRVHHRYHYLDLAGRDYAAAFAEPPDIEVEVTEKNMLEIREALHSPSGQGWPDDYVEYLAAHTLVSECLPHFDTLLLHGAVIVPEDAADRLLGHVFLPHDGLARVRTVELLNKMLKAVDFYEFSCDMTENAARFSFECLTDESWERHRAAVA